MADVTHRSTYDTDLAAWAEEQAALIRAGRFDEVDLENVAEEIDDMSRRQRRELANRMTVLLKHLIKWAAQPDLRPPSWRGSIVEQRRRLPRVLRESPSLVPTLPSVVEEVWPDAVAEAIAEIDLPAPPAVPTQCSWNVDSVLDEGFYPDLL